MRLAAPDRLLRIEADVAILVVGEILEARRQIDLLILEGLRGEIARHPLDKIIRERLGFRQ